MVRLYLCSFVLNGSGAVAADGMRALHRGAAAGIGQPLKPTYNILVFHPRPQQWSVTIPSFDQWLATIEKTSGPMVVGPKMIRTNGWWSY